MFDVAVDISKLKSAVTAPGANYGAPINGRQPLVPARASHKLEIEQMLRSYFVKTGLDVARLEEMVAEDRNEALHVIAARKADAAEQASLNKEALLARVLLQLPITNPVPPTTIPSVLLDPFAIVQLPPIPSRSVTKYFDSNLQHRLNFLYFGVNALDEVISQDFVFYFQWHNDKGESSYVDLATTLTFSGVCDIAGGGGFWEGDTSTLLISAYLNPLEWWIQPPPVPPTQTSQKQDVIDIYHTGPGFFGGDLDYRDPVPLLSCNLNYSDFLIPFYSTAVFAVGVRFSCEIGGSGYADANLLVTCPGLRLTERITDS